MFRKRRLTGEQEARLVAAIARAEDGNRGEVRVHLEGRCSGADPMSRAGALFDELGMRATHADTGVLLYVAERDRQAAVFAGAGVHAAREAGFWQGVVDSVSEGYASDARLDGLERALDAIGDLLREVLSGEDAAGNELPDEVSAR